MYDPNYGNLVWTKHALDRLKQRNLTQSEVLTAIAHPTTSAYGSSHKSIKYRLLTDTKLIEAVIKDDQGKRIVLTCWAAPRSKFRIQIPLWEKAIRKLFQFITSR